MEKQKITSAEIEVGLAQYFNPRRNHVLINASWGLDFRYELDFLSITPAGYGTEVEIKVTKSDIKADLKKRFQHDDRRIRRVFFCVPEELVEFTLETIDPRFGVLKAGMHRDFGVTIYEVRAARIRPNAVPFSDKEISKANSLMNLRVWPLKRAIIALRKDLASLRKELKEQRENPIPF